MSKVKIPLLRFSDFDREWNKTSLGRIGSFKNGLNKSKEDFGFGKPFVNLMDVFGKDVIDNSDLSLVNASKKDLKNYTLRKGDVLFIRSSVKREGVGQAVLVPKNLNDTVYSGFLIRFREKHDLLYDQYKRYCFSTRPFRKELLSYATSSANTNINQESLEQLTLYYPTQKEQQKIADFLSSADQKIQQFRRKKELLEEYKKGVMQKLFSQEIRFKDENGEDFPDWEYIEFGNLFDRVTRKNKEDNQNVLTISAQKGLINQEEYFNRSVAAKDLTGYYLLKKGEFAYNKSYSNGYPLGAIKRLKEYEKGVLSTLYICFKLKEGNSEEFYEEFLDCGGINHEIYKIAQEGSRNHGLLNVSVVDFFKDIEVPRPSHAEQIRIVDFVNSVSKKIEATRQKLELAEKFKKGLLQKMFV